MYIQLSDEYRMIGRSLYQRRGDCYIHVATVPLHIRGLHQAVAWYNSLDQ